MSKRIFIFKELMQRFPAVVGMTHELGVELTVVENGRDVMGQVEQLTPVALLLDVAMPGISGIECCRQIKESSVGRAPVVILASSFSSTTIADRATDAQCDLFVAPSDAEDKLLTYLRERLDGRPQVVAPPTPPIPPLRSHRVDVPGPALVDMAGETKEIWIFNASRSGFLFASPNEMPVGSAIVLHVSREGYGDFQLNAQVSRTAPLKNPVNGLPIVIGVRILPGASAESAQFESFLAAAKREAEESKISPELARQVLEGSVELVTGALQSSQLPYAVYANDVRPFERDSFMSAEPASQCIQRLVLLRLQCRVMAAMAPTLAKERRTLGPTFFPLLSQLVSRADSIEQETDAHVRKAVADGNEAVRNGFNETLNLLDAAKTQLFRRITEKMDCETKVTGIEVIDSIRARVAHLDELRKGVSQDVKYARQAAPVTQEPKEEKKGKRKKPWLLITAASSVAALVLGIVVWDFLTSHVSPSEFQFPIPVVWAVKDGEGGIIITVKQEDWARLGDRDRELTMVAYEAFMRKSNLRQGKLVNEQDRLMAALLPSGIGQGIKYMARYF